MSKRKVTKYTDEFRRSCAKLAADSDQPISTTAEELGVHFTTLHGWVKKYEPDAAKNHPPMEPYPMAQELKTLKKEICHELGCHQIHTCYPNHLVQ